MLHARDIVAIVELIFYIPFAILAILACIRHGFSRSSGWIYTLLLCVLRIGGAICQFLLHKNHSAGLITTTIIIDSVGLSPLLLATLGILNRFVDFINANADPTFNIRHFRLLQLLIVAGLILGIVGGSSSASAATSSDSGTTTITVPTTSKFAIILYIFGYIGLVLIYFLSLPKTSAVPKKERRVPVAITIALPFILIRLIYSACVTFIHNHTFNNITGSVGVFVGMAVSEEFVVIAVYVILGFMVDKLDSTHREHTSGFVLNKRRGRNNRYTTVEPEAQGLNPYQPQPPLSAQEQGITR